MRTAIPIILSAFALGLMTILGNPVAAQSAGNITTPIVPQGASIGATDDNSTGKEQETSAGNITTPIVPQGTSIGSTDDNSTGKEQETSAGNITTPIVPQGTSMGNK
jgi:hypothetical protein